MSDLCKWLGHKDGERYSWRPDCPVCQGTGWPKTTGLSALISKKISAAEEVEKEYGLPRGSLSTGALCMPISIGRVQEKVQVFGPVLYHRNPQRPIITIDLPSAVSPDEEIDEPVIVEKPDGDRPDTDVP